MARGKGAVRGRPKGPPPKHLPSGNTSSTYFSGGPGVSHGQTLADEARNTAQRRHGFFGQDAKLRHNPVSFISAGLMDPLKELDEQFKEANRSGLAKETSHKESRNHSPGVVSPVENALAKSSSNMFVMDTSGDKSLRPGGSAPVIVPILSNHDAEHSDSSEEVILFKGRDILRQAKRTTSRGAETKSKPSPVYQLRGTRNEIDVAEKTNEIREGIPIDETKSEEEAALVADYMANMDKDDEDEDDLHPGLGSHAFMLRDLGGTSSDAVAGPVSDEQNSEDETGKNDPADGLRRKLELEDERMARMLAKQDELGLGGDEVLYGDADSEDDWKMGPSTNIRRKKKGSSRTARIIQNKGQYPSASIMADAFDELDLMDMQGNGFNDAKRGSKIPHVSDSELEEAMQMAVQKDRLKKAEKKKQREALRAQGLLGKNTNPDDLRVKYPLGMRNDELADELEAFLCGTEEQLILPPFDKASRRTVHLVASKLNLKSQSSGSGLSRHPVLYRTGATPSYEERLFTRATRRLIEHTFFSRIDVDQELVREHQAALSGKPNTMNRKRGRNAISYREGDIVGQHAAELGEENKGRLLLEKMGWSKGMALGTLNNKGIMVPIVHVVKKSKAGLGEA